MSKTVSRTTDPKRVGWGGRGVWCTPNLQEGSILTTKWAGNSVFVGGQVQKLLRFRRSAFGGSCTPLPPPLKKNDPGYEPEEPQLQQLIKLLMGLRKFQKKYCMQKIWVCTRPALFTYDNRFIEWIIRTSWILMSKRALMQVDSQWAGTM